MRIPFDLIAAMLCVAGIDGCLKLSVDPKKFVSPTVFSIATVWTAFLLVSWLMNELLTRHIEWRTRFGLVPEGIRGRHPLIVHTWGLRIVQALTVGLYTLALWVLDWPLTAMNWPQWLGLAPEAEVGALPLYASQVAALVLNLVPFLASMVLAWMPRHRLICGLRGRSIPLSKYLRYEARLTWLPLIPMFVMVIFFDGWQMLPEGWRAWPSTPASDFLIGLAFVAFIALIGLPKLVIWWWQCRPLPDGEFKERLLALMAKSGVKARGILVWGPRGSGLLNACVLGPWASYRYVLISPQLLDELTMEEKEAVLAHELGHARFGHLSLLFIMLVTMIALLDPVSDALHVTSPLLASGVSIAFIILYIWGFFGSIMRQCEREADLASAELLGTPQPLIAALEKLALLSGNIRTIYSWHHGSIAERVTAVEKLSADPTASRKFHARVRLIRILFAILTVVAIGAVLALRLTR
jgi:Zn-dependent protease with chaperone function